MVVGHQQHYSGHGNEGDHGTVQTIGPETLERFRDPPGHRHHYADPVYEDGGGRHTNMVHPLNDPQNREEIAYPHSNRGNRIPSPPRPDEASEPSHGRSSNNTDDSSKVKKITVTTTGPFPKQKQFVCNRFVKSYSRFLDEIRERLGCDQSIRCLKSPGGTRVRSLENLRGNNTTYTALCPNDMVRQALGPLSHLPPPPLRPVRRLRHEWIPRSNIYNYVPSRVMDENYYRCRCINVYLNGEFHRRPHRILIDRKIEATNRPFELLLKYTEEKVVTKDTRPVVVRKLYDLSSGRPIRDISEVEDGMTLIACPQFERLMIGDYGRVDRPMNCGKPPSSKRKAFLSKTPTPPEGKQRTNGPSNDNSPRHPDFDLRGHPPSQRRQINPLPPLPPISKRPPRSEPTPQTVHTNEELQDDFKAKPSSAKEDAREVPDTQETVTDLPVEQRDAEEVEEVEEEPAISERQPSEEEVLITRRPFRRRETSPSDDRYEDLSEEKTQRPKDDDDEVKRNAAATTVQAGYRGYQTRRNLAAQKTKEPSPKPAVADEEPAPEPAEEEPNEPQKEHNVDDEKEEEKPADDGQDQAAAATKIQAGYRGYKTRKELKSQKDEEAKPVEEQKNKEGEKDDKVKDPEDESKPEKEVEDSSEKDKAATTIQAGYRGHRTRKELKQQQQTEAEDKDQEKAEEPPTEPEQKDETKEDDDEERKRTAAATKIQAGYRGYQTRSQLKAEKDGQPQEEPKSEDKPDDPQEPDADDDLQKKSEAATKIQAGYRGYQTRQQLKSERASEKSPPAEEPLANGGSENINEASDGDDAKPPTAEEPANKDADKVNGVDGDGAGVSQGSAA